MEPLVDAQEAVSLCNSVLVIAGVNNPISSVPEVRALGANVSLFVAATEVLLGQRLEKIHRSPSNAIQRSANCAAVLSALERALGDISLAHIIPSAIVAGDLLHITSMMELIVELARMPGVLKPASGNRQSAEQVATHQHSKQLTGNLDSPHGNHLATRRPTSSRLLQAESDKTAVPSAETAASLAVSTSKHMRHPKPCPGLPVHAQVPAAAAAADPASQAAVQQQHGLPTAVVARHPAVAAVVARQPGSRSASPGFRSGTPAWPGDLADTSSALQGLADYKPKQLQRVMGLANSLLEQQHSGSDVGRSGTPVFGRAARAGPAVATTAVVRGNASEHGAQAGNPVASAASWLDSEESAAEEVLQQLRRANQDIKDSKMSAVVPAEAATRARAASPLRHQQHRPNNLKQPEQSDIGTSSSSVLQVGQQQQPYELEAGQTLDNHIADDLEHLQGVAQQLAEIRAAEEQLAAVEQQIQQHRQLLQQQEHADGILAALPPGGMSCVITEITSSTDLDSHKMQGNISGGEGLPLVSGRPKHHQQQPSDSFHVVIDAPGLGNHNYRSNSPGLLFAVPTTAVDSIKAGGGRPLTAANSPDLGLEVLRSAGLMDLAYGLDYDAEQDSAIEMVAALILENDGDLEFGVDIDDDAAAEVANCIASHAHLGHLQEVALELATLQEQQQRQQLEQQKELFRWQSQVECKSDGQRPSGEEVTLAAWKTAELSPVQPQQQDEEDSSHAVGQQHHQQKFGELELGVLAGQPAADGTAYKAHTTQLPSSRKKPGGKRPRKGSKHSPWHDIKQKQESPAIRWASNSKHSVQRSPRTLHRLSSSRGCAACSDWRTNGTTQSSRGRSASAVHHSTASPGSQTTPQQHAQAYRHRVSSDKTRRSLLQQLLDSSSSDSSVTAAEPLAAQESWSHASTGYQTSGAWTVTKMQARPQHPPSQKQQQQQQQQEPVDQQQGRKASAAAAAKVMDARIHFEIAQQHMLQQQVLRHQAAAVRRQQWKEMQQQELLSKQEAYDTKIASMRKKQRRDQRRRDKLRKQSQAATEAAIEAAEAAGMYDAHHVTTSSHVKSPQRVTTWRSSPPKQLALQTQDAAALTVGLSGKDTMANNADVADQLQQLKDDYEKVIFVFEDLLVSERRGRVDAERSLAQLVRQLRSEGKLGSTAMCSVV